MKPLTLVCFFLFLAGVFLFLSQMWFHVWSSELFVKLIVTDGAAFLVVFVIAFLVREQKATERINKGNDALD